MNSLRHLPSVLFVFLLWQLFFATPAEAAEAPTVALPPSTAAPTATAPIVKAPPDTAPAPTTLQAERISYAVVIGNNKSLGARRPDLHYADDDAARYFDILQTLAPARVSLLSDFDRDTAKLFPEAAAHARTPTRDTLLSVGRHLATQVKAANAAGHETEVYFIFAGHGDVAQGEGFVELADSRFLSSELEAWLKGIPFTRAHVILDSCNSFFMLGVRKPGGRHFATSEDAARRLSARLPNVGVFLSTSAEGESFEWSELQSGIFSHVVRSGLLGGADANADGAVSYLELAAFVDTATAEIANPNMRPHVFARGPGASDNATIAHLRSMVSVRHFAFSQTGTLRLRLLDARGIPLIDAHTEAQKPLALSLPAAWAKGAVVERSTNAADEKQHSVPLQRYAVPLGSDRVTLAMLAPLQSRSAARGPAESFEKLFARPFGPNAVAGYASRRSSEPPPVFGVTKEDARRMQLVLDELHRAERGKRMSEAMGGVGFGTLLAGAGIGVLSIDPDVSSSDRRKARIQGGVMLGVGSLMALGSLGSLWAPSMGEKAANDFRKVIRAGGDTAQAFSVADKQLRELVQQRRTDRLGGLFVGGAIALGSAASLAWSEVRAAGNNHNSARRLSWGAGILLGSLIVGDSWFAETPGETLSRIWRDDPSLHQYQTTIDIGSDGASLNLSTAW